MNCVYFFLNSFVNVVSRRTERMLFVMILPHTTSTFYIAQCILVSKSFFFLNYNPFFRQTTKNVYVGYIGRVLKLPRNGIRRMFYIPLFWANCQQEACRQQGWRPETLNSFQLQRNGCCCTWGTWINTSSGRYSHSPNDSPIPN